VENARGAHGADVRDAGRRPAQRCEVDVRAKPIVLGVGDDKAGRDVTVEGVSLQRWDGGAIANDAA